MKLETIYNRLRESMEKQDFNKQKDLLEDIAQAIRLESAYKTTSKTRVNAIKRVASKMESRPALTCYGICGDYKVITDSYHLVAIYDDNIPLKLATTDRELADKVGHENCRCFNYPNVSHLLDFNKDSYDIIDLDYKDIIAYHKMHSKNADKEPYEIKGNYVNIKYLKNIIDILGTDIKCYVSKKEKDRIPLYFENDNNEIGLILPIMKY